MRVLGVVLVLVLCVCRGAAAVQVQVGDRSFPLEAVKQLMLLMDLDDSVNPHLAETSVAAVCADPLLPQIFLPVCEGKGAGIAFSKLECQKQVMIIKTSVINREKYGRVVTSVGNWQGSMKNRRLAVDIMTSIDPCEICANPACFGCQD